LRHQRGYGRGSQNRSRAIYRSDIVRRVSFPATIGLYILVCSLTSIIAIAIAQLKDRTNKDISQDIEACTSSAARRRRPTGQA
jgi:hypothetical protein